MISSEAPIQNINYRLSGYAISIPENGSYRGGKSFEVILGKKVFCCTGL